MGGEGSKQQIFTKISEDGPRKFHYVSSHNIMPTHLDMSDNENDRDDPGSGTRIHLIKFTNDVKVNNKVRVN